MLLAVLPQNWSRLVIVNWNLPNLRRILSVKGVNYVHGTFVCARRIPLFRDSPFGNSLGQQLSRLMDPKRAGILGLAFSNAKDVRRR
jgi:hypothetical protein